MSNDQLFKILQNSCISTAQGVRCHCSADLSPDLWLVSISLKPLVSNSFVKTACKYIMCHWIIDCTMLVYVDVVARDKQCKPQCQYWCQHLHVSCCSDDLYLTYDGFPTCSECSSSWSKAFRCKKSLNTKKSAKK